MGVMKSKMGTIGSKMGGEFEQKRKARWVKKKKKIWSRPNPVREYWCVNHRIETQPRLNQPRIFCSVYDHPSHTDL